ncbi:hypothetical protein KL925_003960 [Ogataea polymorpha]|nr:hypothetical protein KL925_003960 [Ogataea polymorpha]KAG7932700.1 hypothetical protein KL934_003355 [Ogataea polymorpha]
METVELVPVELEPVKVADSVNVSDEAPEVVPEAAVVESSKVSLVAAAVEAPLKAAVVLSPEEGSIDAVDGWEYVSLEVPEAESDETPFVASEECVAVSDFVLEVIVHVGQTVLASELLPVLSELEVHVGQTVLVHVGQAVLLSDAAEEVKLAGSVPDACEDVAGDVAFPLSDVDDVELLLETVSVAGDVARDEAPIEATEELELSGCAAVDSEAKEAAAELVWLLVTDPLELVAESGAEEKP